MATRTCLKRGSLGDVWLETRAGQSVAVRELRTARLCCRWLARRLARREARALTRLSGLPGVPGLISLEPDRLVRAFIPGRVMHQHEPRSRGYYRNALALLRQLHRNGVTHNDLAKEANWICPQDNEVAIVDFQLALCFRRRGRLFRTLAREDLRHLLKHKAHYRPDALTRRQRDILATPAWPARIWRTAVKPGYLLLTRGLLGWPEREGADERQRPT